MSQPSPSSPSPSSTDATVDDATVDNATVDATVDNATVDVTVDAIAASDDPPPEITPATPAGPPKLRPYQVTLISDLYRELNEGHQRIAIIAGTGAGKTIISGKICAHAGKRASG